MLKFPTNGTPTMSNNGHFDKVYHPGIDWALVHRTAIVSKANGKVTLVENDIEKRVGIKNWIAWGANDPFKGKRFALRTEDYGNYIKINYGRTKDGQLVEGVYAHLDEVITYVNEYVKEGQLVAYSDNSGNSTGNHLHEELRLDGKNVDPLWFYDNFPDFTGISEHEEDLTKRFYPVTRMVTVHPFVDILYVRSEPIRRGTHEKPSNLTGSETLTKNEKFKVIGFVNGEDINGNPFWWLSSKGNYVWSGGTIEQADPDELPESILNSLPLKEVQE